MNKSIAILAGGVILGAVALQALAQTTGRPAVQQTSGSNPPATGVAAPQVVPIRVAVVNINKVLKNFNKAQQLNSFISNKVSGYRNQITAKREELAKIQEKIAKAVNPAEAEELKKQGVALERQMQDLDAEASKDISNQQGTIAIGIYKDIEGVIQRCAVTNGFDIVLSFPDATVDAEMYTQPNVVRKLAAQAAIPLFYKAHVDMTQAVIDTLNAQFPVAAAPPAAPATTQPTITPVGNNQPQKKQ